MKSNPRVTDRPRRDPAGGDQNAHSSRTRSVVGVAFTPDCRRVSAALVSAQGVGLLMRPEVGAHLEAAVPTSVFQSFQRSAESPAVDRHELLTLAEGLAGVVGGLTDRLVGSTSDAPLAVSVEDPGLWTQDDEGGVRYGSLLDSAWLAEQTGLNVLDGLPSRDIVQRGRGGPLATMGHWLLLAAREPTDGRWPVRGLLELEDTMRLTYLPRLSNPHSTTLPLAVLDLGPGLALLDPLAGALTRGDQSSDVHGALAVQGRQMPEMLQKWLGAAPFQPRPWHRHGRSAEPLLDQARNDMRDHGWSARDILCTATHLLAASIADATQRCFPKSVPPVEELILTGRGRQNGFLQKEIRVRLPNVAVTTTDQFGLDDAALYPASIGILALLYIDRVPAGGAQLTGAAVPRLLGRLTPGNPANWHRLLTEMARVEPPKMTLRAAI